MMRIFTLGFACLLAVTGATSVMAADEGEAPAVLRPVVSEIVTPHSGLRPSWVGTVTARTETDLGFPLIGTLAERAVSVGDIVVKGQVLGLQDPQDLDSELRAAQAGVIVAEAQANSARDAAARASELVSRGISSLSSEQSATAQRAASEAQLEQARATLARAQDARDYATLHAPQDGVVTQVFAEPGATLSAGDPVLRLAGTDHREVVIDLSEEDVADFAPGAVFRVRLEANPALVATTRLVSVDPVATRATRTRRLRLALEPDAPEGFRLGALVQVVPGAETATQTSIPVSALIDGREPAQVWRITSKQRRAQAIEIETGPRAGGRVLVLQGLSDGDEIIVKGVNSIEDGQEIGPRVQE